MGAPFFHSTTAFGRAGLALLTAVAIAWPALTVSAAARGPEGISDVAEQVIDAVVNVSTKQSVDLSSGAMPQLPPGSPFEEFFEEFFEELPRARRSERTEWAGAVAAAGQFARLGVHH